MKKFGSALIIISGILFIIFGIIVVSNSYGDFENDVKYGGDAYTGIQNAAAATARNLYYLLSELDVAFAMLFIGGGIALFGCGIYRMGVCVEEENKSIREQYNRSSIESNNGNTSSNNVNTPSNKRNISSNNVNTPSNNDNMTFYSVDITSLDQ